MKYVATIYIGPGSSAQSFDKISDAKQWLDAQNNNLEYATKIEEVDDKWNVVDWFWYTEAAK